VDLNIKLAEALVINPGDRVLLLLRDDGWTEGNVNAAKSFLEERFPDVTFGFISHVEGAVVEREPDPVGVTVTAADLRRVLDQRVQYSHMRPGSWDDSNRPEIAGRLCVECAARDRLRAALDVAEKG
jgi:hypothetical protein